MTAPPSTVQSATELAAAGTPVFPCRHNKAPATPHGFHDAVTGADAARQLWRTHPGPLIGVPTGAVSGFDVLDIDPRHGGERWYLTHAHRLPPTRMHRTRSGGLHVLFQHADKVRNTAAKLAPGVDTRGEGGFIIWWPAHGCLVADADVAPWPRWLLNRLLKEPKPAPAPPSTSFATLDSADRAQRAADSILRRVKDAAAGQRHYTLRKGAYALGGLLDRLPFGKSEAVDRLVAAIKEAGAADLVNAKKTAEWGIDCGKAKPLGREAR